MPAQKDYFIKTKNMATIGPASNKRDVLSKLIAAGVRIFRLNFSHGASSSFVALIKMIRELEIVHQPSRPLGPQDPYRHLPQ